jgi:nucleotide-binding universal stress UspA family protein
MNLKTILVPTDFTPEAERALGVAATLARRSGAEILLLHVIDVPSVPMGAAGINNIGFSDKSDEDPVGTYVPKLVERTKEKLRALMAKYNDLSLRKHVVFDDEARELADFVTREQADLVVMGTKNPDQVEPADHTVERVIRQARVPVLVVKGRLETPNLANIVFASDFKDVPAQAVDQLKTIQQICGATMHLVKIIPPRLDINTQKDTLNLLSAFATKHHLDNYTCDIYIGENKDEAIRRFAETMNADLIAMTLSGRTGLAQFLFGNLTEKVANHASRPILTLSERA